MIEIPDKLLAAAATSEVTLQPEQVSQVLKALGGCLDFLIRRDQMNAAVHCAEPRWSPLSDQVQDAVHMLTTVAVEQSDSSIPADG